MNTQLQNTLQANVKSAAQASCNPMSATEHVRVGDYFASSWGYEQTNVCFYQVVGVSVRKITLRKVEALKHWNDDHTSGGYCEPIADQFVGESFGRLYDAEYKSVRIESGETARLWSGEQMIFTSHG